jgi:hypothetical protein
MHIYSGAPMHFLSGVDNLLAHLSPLGWEHVNLTGDYVWDNQQGTSENTDGLRPLRATPELTRQAA